MGELRHRRGLIAWIAVIALLGNVVAGFFSPTLALRSASDYPVDLLGPLVICTDHGTQIAPDDGKPPEAPGKHCPMCLAAAVVAFLVALATAVLLAPLTAGRRVSFHYCATLMERLRPGGLGSRAPPLPA